jgi:membrane-bound inhibitor of C-type lysozyme
VRGVAILLLLALAGCRGHTPPTPAAAPPAAAAGPVNPDPGVTTYACIDGQRITAGYPDAQTAVVTYKDHAYTLKLAPSADGARYTGYGLQWWTRGPRATIAALKAGEDTASDPGLACTAEGESASDVTHTSLPRQPPPGRFSRTS